ncbi:MAG: ABC transporter permease subunit [Rhodospirillaceae bacterium]|nr:ABC transporter permease subunit [Rhodospirillaceae bacterium]MDE0255432.1 ABC transporter permease subunit [Rhodospirillaceae bacterium]MDE0618215.1 ABC transporter permease subunit [Rhodospirillaceae bacterium]MDE0718054.1 ABC transporter permease subunit [Rhodospirillaceae bacterium]MYF09093.1 ABC transporter permease subunit [Rhodospirillaceae bacterium]
MRTGRRLIQDYWGILLILVAWQAWVIVNQFNPIVMPTPISVFDALVTDPVLFLENTGITFAVALVGMTGGMIIGTSLAVATWLSPLLSGLVSPLAVLFSSVPVVALIPIIARLLGYNVSTEIAIVVIITFFPSFVFASSGLRALPPGSDDLFRVLGASRRATLFRLALPAAMPNLAIALRLAAAHAILAAMIAEFLMGTSGLGYLFAKTNDEFQTEQAFGTSIVATAISVAAFLLASFVERRVRAHFS